MNPVYKKVSEREELKADTRRFVESQRERGQWGRNNEQAWLESDTKHKTVIEAWVWPRPSDSESLQRSVTSNLPWQSHITANLCWQATVLKQTKLPVLTVSGSYSPGPTAAQEGQTSWNVNSRLVVTRYIHDAWFQLSNIHLQGVKLKLMRKERGKTYYYTLLLYTLVESDYRYGILNSMTNLEIVSKIKNT